MKVVVSRNALDQVIEELVSEDRSFHSKNVNELEKAAPPIFPNPQVATQISRDKMPVEDPAFMPTTKTELGKAAMEISHEIDDRMIARFYKALKKLANQAKDKPPQKTSNTHSIAEARSVIDNFVKKVIINEAEGKVLRRRKGSKDVEVINTTPAEDMADVGAEIDTGRRGVAPTADSPAKQRKSKSAASRTTEPGESRDVTSEYLKSLYDQNAPIPEWLKNVSIPMSSLVVGDANKLLAAIVKKIGEENVTPETLEAELQNVINGLTYSIKGDAIVIGVPGYGYNYTYNLNRDKRNLFSLEQYKELLNALGSQTSEGTQFEDSWGPKYAKAIKMLRYAEDDAALYDALLGSIPKVQRALTDAVLDTYPETQELINPKEVASRLYDINQDVIDRFVQQGITSGTNTITIDVEGKPVTLSIDIPESEPALRAIADSKFGNLLEELLSIAPDALQDYIEKKRRTPRSAVPMDRGQQNYFYDLGMKIGGENFKMSAEDFQKKLIAAKQVVEDEKMEITDQMLVTMIMLSGDIIDKNQFNLLASVKDVIWDLFSDTLQSNPKLQKQFGGLDNMFAIVPEDLGEASTEVRDAFDDFCERVVKAFTDKSVKNKFFDIYDKIVDDPATKAYFKETAGVKHSQIYDQPGAGRRAKDVSNLVGNLRHISRVMMDNAKSLRRTGSTLIADRIEKDAKQLVDPETLASTLKLFIKSKTPLLAKALDAPAKEIMKHSFETLTTPPPERSVTTPAAQPEVAPAPAETPAPAAPPASSRTPSDVTSAIDEIISDFKDISDPVEKEAFIARFDVALEDGPSEELLTLYPELTTAQDYQRLVSQLNALNETTYISLITNLIRESAKR